MIEALVYRQQLGEKILAGGDEASVNIHALGRKTTRKFAYHKSLDQKMPSVFEGPDAWHDAWLNNWPDVTDFQ